MKPQKHGPRRARKVALSALFFGFATLVGLVIVRRDVLLEPWYLHVLETGAGEERQRAIRTLGAMRSQRAVPGLIAYIDSLGVWERDIPAAFGDEPAVAALVAIGPSAMEQLVREAKEADVRLVAVEFLALRDDDTDWTRVFRAAREDPSPDVREAALRALPLRDSPADRRAP